MENNEILMKVLEAVEGLQKGQQVTNERLDIMQEDISGLKQDVSGLKQDVSGLKEGQARLEQDVSGLNTEVVRLATHVKKLEVFTENKVSPQIKLIAEGNRDLAEKVDRIDKTVQVINEKVSDLSLAARMNVEERKQLRLIK